MRTTRFNNILVLIAAMLAAAFITACDTSNHNTGTDRGKLVVKFTAPAAKVRARDTTTPALPAELTRIVFELKDGRGEKVAEADWINSNEEIEFELASGLPHTLSGTAYAGTETLFSGTAEVRPLAAGESRPVAITLAPTVTVSLPSFPTSNLVTPQTLLRVKVGSADSVELTPAINGLSDKRVRYLVNDIEGGNATIGFINGQGLYAPPRSVPENSVVTLKIVPVAAPSFDVSVAIQLVQNGDIPIVTAPTGLIAEPGNGLVKLSWQSSGAGVTYSVFRSTASGVPLNSDPIVFGLESTTFTDARAANGTPYFYIVAAFSLAGPSAASNEVSATPSLAPCVWDTSAWDGCKWQ